MDSEPYSIYVRKRPQKVVFLVNPRKLTTEQIDRIFDHNRSRWGGRFNPVIFTNGKEIEDGWWKFLLDIDPDVIKSLVPLTKGLIKKIDHSLSPYLFEVPRDGVLNDEDFHLAEDGISILPDVLNIGKAGMSYGPTLVIFKLDGAGDQLLKNFVRFNFGEILMTAQAQRALEKLQTKVFEITNFASLAAALRELSNGFKTYIYPIQLSSVPDQFEDIEYSETQEAFTVFLGSSANEIIGFWNNIFSLIQYERRNLKQFWLPREVIENPEMDDALCHWFQRMGDPYGSGRKRVQFLSFSYTSTELEALAEKYKRGVFTWITHKALNEFEFPHFREPYRFVSQTSDTEIFRANGKQEIITITSPNIANDADPGRHWMADVYVQFPPNRYKNYVNKEFWWQFPKRNGFAIQMFDKRAARVKSDGFLSVPMSGKNPRLNIHLPDEWGIFWGLILGQSNYFYSSDPRRSIKEKKFGHTERSDKGRYLSGLLEIFQGLFMAHHYFSERYWRTMFDKLSNQNPLRDAGRLKVISDKLKKQMRTFGSDFQGANAATDGVSWLSEYVLQTSKEQASSGQELRFEAFVEEAKKEMQEFNASQGAGRAWKFNKKDVKHALERMTESNLIDMGYRPYCPLCGSPNWYKVDEARQQLDCKGCSYKFSLRPEEDYYYRLNGRIQAACTKHGLAPVILVLGELLGSSRTSFIYMPSLDVFRKRDGEVFSDLDIVCIQDGKFIIGEVKMNQKLFKQADFDRMLEIAKIIKPDKVIFSSLERTQTTRMKNMITSIKPQMEELGVEVSWHQIAPYYFDPSPVR